MGQFLQVNGDYNIKSAEGGKITFDTGPASSGGQVLITGNLVVEGTQTTVSANDLVIKDHIIILNAGETGPGVTLINAGIEIDRGTEPYASFLFNETDDTWFIATGTDPGPFNFSQSNLRLRTILTDAGTDGGDLTLIGSGTGVVKVVGTINYEDQVTADDDIPNKRYVDDAIQNNPTFQIVAPQSQDTRVVIADKEITPDTSGTPGSLAYLTATTGYSTFGESAVSIIVDGQLNTQFYPNRALIGQLELSGTEISTENSITNENIFIRTQGTGKLQTNYALQIEKIASAPAYVPNSLLLYGATPSIGTSGVWYVNDSADTRKQTGELISKNKALVFSMIF